MTANGGHELQEIRGIRAFFAVTLCSSVSLTDQIIRRFSTGHSILAPIIRSAAGRSPRGVEKNAEDMMVAAILLVVDFRFPRDVQLSIFRRPCGF